MLKLSIKKALRRAKTLTLINDGKGARTIYEAILRADPGNAEAMTCLAKLSQDVAPGQCPKPGEDELARLVELTKKGKYQEAIEHAETLTRHFPNSYEAWHTIGFLSQIFRDLTKAEAAFHQAIAIQPHRAEAQKSLGKVLADIGKPAEALKCFEVAVQLDPGRADSHNALGTALRALGRLDDALAAFRRSLEIDPSFANAHYNIAVIMRDRGLLDEAVLNYDRAVAADPTHALARADKLHFQLHMCDWSAYGEFKTVAADLGVRGGAVPPFLLLPLEDDPERHAARTRRFAQHYYERKPLPFPAAPEVRQKRIRIGYFSADFFDHATLFLMSGLFRLHDRRKFEVFVYDYSLPTKGEMREKVRGDVDHFFAVQKLSDVEVAMLARSHGIDIAVDLKGYTQSSRSQIFAYRAAPVQINFLGYPGTMGAKFMDYIVADPIVISADERQHYDERVIYMPNTYQPNDNERAIADVKSSRREFGLPDRGFVFCCFNNNYKIGPHEFDIWMRLLREVPNSVLWLFHANQWAEDNLRREAANRNVEPARLVFAGRLPHREHLARHRHADLFLDTFNYNAHTTASDALWAGLPLLTKIGRQFSARVAASLLTAVGLPDLITEDVQAYEQLALRLATEPEKLAAVRKKLGRNRLTTPLFDSERYTRDYERLLTRVYAKQRGEVVALRA